MTETSIGRLRTVDLTNKVANVIESPNFGKAAVGKFNFRIRRIEHERGSGRTGTGCSDNLSGIIDAVCGTTTALGYFDCRVIATAQAESMAQSVKAAILADHLTAIVYRVRDRVGGARNFE
jgi:hypothetical protein